MNPKLPFRILLYSGLVLLCLVQSGCGRSTPDYLRVAPQDEPLLSAGDRESIHSLAIRWTREWVSLPDADARLHELVDLGLTKGAVDSVQAALAASDPTDREVKTPGKEELRTLLASLTEIEPRLGWMAGVAATNRLAARVVVMALLIGTEVVDGSDPNPRGREGHAETRAFLRALLATSDLESGFKGEPNQGIETAILKDQLAEWLGRGAWTCVEATSRKGDGFPGLMKGARFEFSHAELRVSGTGAEARHPYRVLKAMPSTNPDGVVFGLLQVGGTEESLLQLKAEGGADVAGMSWGAGAWTLKLVRRH